MKKDFLVINLNFDDDIVFPYEKKIIDITNKNLYEISYILDTLILELIEAKEHHKDSIHKVRFLDKCIGGINYLCKYGNDLCIIEGNWDFEIIFEIGVNITNDSVYTKFKGK